MSLAVPPIEDLYQTRVQQSNYMNPYQTPVVKITNSLVEKPKPYNVKFDSSRREVIFDDGQPLTIRNNDWVVITIEGKLQAVLESLLSLIFFPANHTQQNPQPIIESMTFHYIQL
jgi:hypothetical protein